MYFHAVGAALASLHDEIPVKVGIDPASTEWHILYHYHAAVSDKGFDVDFSEWDATVPAVFLEKCVVIYNAIYRACDVKHKDEDDVIRTTLFSHLVKPLLVYFDYVVQAPGGQVSGQPFTSLDNCLINMMYNAYIYIKLAREHCPKEATFGSWLKSACIS